MELFLRSVGIGLAIAAPVGPIGVLCIRRSVAHGRVAGLATGLGAATADAAYGAIAAFGLTAASDALLRFATPMRIVGGAFLVLLGARTFFARPAAAPIDGNRGLVTAYTTSVGLTITNPTTILSFAAVFASIGFIDEDPGAVLAALIVAGIFLGSAAWWLFLSWLASRAAGRLNLRAVNRVSGVVVGVFGVAALATAL